MSVLFDCVVSLVEAECDSLGYSVVEVGWVEVDVGSVACYLDSEVDHVSD